MRTALLLALASPLALADFQAEWDKLPENADPDAKEEFLRANRERFVKDPAFWIAFANTAWNRHQGIRIERGEPQPGDFRLEKIDEDVTGRLTAGKPTEEDVDEAIGHLDEALKLAPHRIDIWRGRLDLLHWSGRHDTFLAEADRFAAVASAREKAFLTKDGEEVDEAASQTGVQALHDFVIDHFNAETEEGDAMIRKTAELMVKHFPRAVYGYNDLALHYDLVKKPDLALDNLAKAWDIAPTDPIVALNYAEFLRKAEKSAEAKRVLQKLLKSEELIEEDRARAEEVLRSLEAEAGSN